MADAPVRHGALHLDGRTITLFGKPYRWRTDTRLGNRLVRLTGQLGDYTYDPHGLIAPSPCAAWVAQQQGPTGQPPGGTTQEETAP